MPFFLPTKCSWSVPDWFQVLSLDSHKILTLLYSACSALSFALTFSCPGRAAKERFAMSRSGTLLSVCRRTGAVLIRNQVLRQAGYTVVTADGLDDALDAACSGRFDLVVIGDLFNTDEKNLIATTARHAGSKVLCIHSETNPPDVRDATAFIHILDGPNRLLAKVAGLVRKAASA
jgi:hypothetical protein